MWRKFDFQENVDDYIFRGRRPEEEIILFLRRHWLILVFKLIPAAFFLGGLFFVGLFKNQAVAFLDWEIEIFNLGYSSLFLFFWILLFIFWIDYYLDVWIVTDQRIINIEQKGLFRRSISELELGKIQDVTSEVTGIIPTLFDYGFVFIQTAGEKERFVFQQVPSPVRVKNIIMQVQKRALLAEKRMEGEILRGKV